MQFCLILLNFKEIVVLNFKCNRTKWTVVLWFYVFRENIFSSIFPLMLCNYVLAFRNTFLSRKEKKKVKNENPFFFSLLCFTHGFCSTILLIFSILLFDLTILFCYRVFLFGIFILKCIAHTHTHTCPLLLLSIIYDQIILYDIFFQFQNITIQREIYMFRLNF